MRPRTSSSFAPARPAASWQRRKPGKYREMIETKRAAQGVRAQLPVLTVVGAKPGPVAFIMSNQHGRELHGIPAIARVFAQLRPEKMTGTAVFLPVMNPVGTRMRRQDYPLEEPRYRPTNLLRADFNINRHWTDNAQDRNRQTYAATIAETVWKRYWRYADVSLDLHGWTGMSLSLAWAERKDLNLLRGYGFPWHQVQDKPVPPDSGLSEAIAHQAGIPHLITELSPQNTLDPAMVAAAVRSITNLLKLAGLLKGRPELPPIQYEFDEAHVETALRPDAEGILVSDLRKGDFVRQGQLVAQVLSLETLAPVWEFHAPHDALVFNLGGVIWGEDFQDSAIVYPGQIVGLLKQPTHILRNSQRS